MNTTSLPSYAQLAAVRDADWAIVATEYGFTGTPDWVSVSADDLLEIEGIELQPGCACWGLNNGGEFLVNAGPMPMPIFNLVLYGPDANGNASCWMS